MERILDENGFALCVVYNCESGVAMKAIDKKNPVDRPFIKQYNLALWEKKYAKEPWFLMNPDANKIEEHFRSRRSAPAIYLVEKRTNVKTNPNDTDCETTFYLHFNASDRQRKVFPIWYMEDEDFGYFTILAKKRWFPNLYEMIRYLENNKIKEIGIKLRLEGRRYGNLHEHYGLETL